MSFVRIHRGLTRRTRSLLAGGENAFVDFKQTASGVTAEDLVAFANSDSGGEILIGVAEARRVDGSQFGQIIGHELDDNAVLQILNKAVSCVPPVAVRLYAENKDVTPIIRIHVPSGLNKPYSTSKGIYCRRDGSRNRPLHPGELLQIFLDAEGRAFAARFEQAAKAVVDSMTQLEKTLEEKIESMGSQLGWAEYKVGDTEDTINTVLAHVHRVREDTEDIATRLRTLFRQDSRDDPVRTQVRAAALKELKDQLAAKPELVKAIRKKDAKIQAVLSNKAIRELDSADWREIFAEAVKSAAQEQ